MTTTTRDRAWDSYYIDAWRIGHQWGLRQHVSSPRYIFFSSLYLQKTIIQLLPAPRPPPLYHQTAATRQWGTGLEMCTVYLSWAPCLSFFSFNDDNKGRGIYLDLFILVIQVIILYINIDGYSFFTLFCILVATFECFIFKSNYFFYFSYLWLLLIFISRYLK